MTYVYKYIDVSFVLTFESDIVMKTYFSYSKSLCWYVTFYVIHILYAIKKKIQYCIEKRNRKLKAILILF